MHNLQEHNNLFYHLVCVFLMQNKATILLFVKPEKVNLVFVYDNPTVRLGKLLKQLAFGFQTQGHKAYIFKLQTTSTCPTSLIQFRLFIN